MNHFNLPYDMPIKLFQFVGGNPVFEMKVASNTLDLVSTQKIAIDLKASNISRPGFLNIPIASDLNCVLFT